MFNLRALGKLKPPSSKVDPQSPLAEMISACDGCIVMTLFFILPSDNVSYYMVYSIWYTVYMFHSDVNRIFVITTAVVVVILRIVIVSLLSL